jgi:hypothetical protein
MLDTATGSRAEQRSDIAAAFFLYAENGARPSGFIAVRPFHKTKSAGRLAGARVSRRSLIFLD